MTQPAPGYQPYQPMAPMMGVAAPPRPSRGGVTTMLAGLLALVVAGLAVGGSFGAISTFRDSYEGDGDPVVSAIESTWWGYSYDDGSIPAEDQSHLGGLTLVLVAALLVLGAVFAFVAARTRASGAVSGTRSLISAGVGLLAGASLIELFALLGQMERYNEQELQAGESLEFTAGAGMWLPLGGVVLGVVAVVLAHVGQGPRAARVEPTTPRMGFPAPYGYPPQRPMPQQQVPQSERPTDVAAPADDAVETQVVGGATADDDTPPRGVQAAMAGEAAPPAAPALQPTAPPMPTTPAAPAPAPRPVVAPATEPPAPITPATTAAPPEEPAQQATPAPAAEPSAPATPATTSAAETPAPPAPELSAPEDKEDDEK